MPSINLVTLGGNFIRDPDIKYAKTGNAYARFNLAATVYGRDKDGQQTKEPFWSPNCIAFKELAEGLSGAKKGDSVLLVGSLQNDNWEDPKTKEKRYGFAIKCRELKWSPKKSEGQPQPADSQPVDPPVDPQVGF